jgi:hypothetical protein
MPYSPTSREIDFFFGKLEPPFLPDCTKQRKVHKN